MKKKILKGLLATSLVLSAVPAVVANAEDAAPKSKNLIVLIGDGMGPAQVTAARWYKQHVLKQGGLELDKYFVGQATTYADRGEDDGKVVSGIVTDSASAGTAFATGNKTYNAGISVSNEEVAKPFASVIEAAEMEEKATGLVSTARITHATPATYAAHVRHRDNENAIAFQYLESGVDVLLGGGSGNFVSKEEGGKRADETILDDFQDAGYEYVMNAEELTAATAEEGKLIGLFGSSHVKYVLDRDASVPNLAAMTDKAISVLSKNENGFVMMVEGGRIDHASHANDFPSTVQEMLDFDAAVKVAMDFAKKDGNTSVVITADHETGGLSLARDNIYEMNYDLWNKQTASSETIGKKLKELTTIDEVKAYVAEVTWIKDLSDAEAQYILTGDGTSYGREGGFNAVVSKRLLVGWTGHGHTGVDVGVWAYGPIADLVKGQIDNTLIAQAGAEVLGADLALATQLLQERFLYPKFMVTQEGEVMFPARALSNELDITYTFDAATNSYNFEVEKVVSVEHETTEGGEVGAEFTTTVVNVDMKTKEVKVNGEATTDVVAAVEKGKLYFNLEAFNVLTGYNMTWDTLSERINVER